MLKTANFLGEQTAGTVFQIIVVTGINIKDYSAIPGEDEVVLPPGTQFVVDKITPLRRGRTRAGTRTPRRRPPSTKRSGSTWR